MSTMAMLGQPHGPRVAIVALALATLVGCGVSEGATTATRPETRYTAADLRPLLPSPDEVGDGYRPMTPDADTSGPGDDALAKACPKAATLGEDDRGGAGEVKAQFEAESSKTIQVSMRATRDIGIDEANVDDYVDVINACDTIHYRDAGQSITIDLAARRDDHHGDFGVRLDVDLTTTTDQGEIDITYRALFFVHGPVGASITVNDGIDVGATQSVPGDFDRIDPLAGLLDTRIGDLVD